MVKKAASTRPKNEPEKALKPEDTEGPGIWRYCKSCDSIEKGYKKKGKGQHIFCERCGRQTAPIARAPKVMLDHFRADRGYSVTQVVEDQKAETTADKKSEEPIDDHEFLSTILRQHRTRSPDTIVTLFMQGDTTDFSWFNYVLGRCLVHEPAKSEIMMAWAQRMGLDARKIDEYVKHGKVKPKITTGGDGMEADTDIAKMMREEQELKKWERYRRKMAEMDAEEQRIKGAAGGQQGVIMAQRSHRTPMMDERGNPKRDADGNTIWEEVVEEYPVQVGSSGKIHGTDSEYDDFIGNLEKVRRRGMMEKAYMDAVGMGKDDGFGVKEAISLVASLKPDSSMKEVAALIAALKPGTNEADIYKRMEDARNAFEARLDKERGERHTFERDEHKRQVEEMNRRYAEMKEEFEKSKSRTKGFKDLITDLKDLETTQKQLGDLGIITGRKEETDIEKFGKYLDVITDHVDIGPIMEAAGERIRRGGNPGPGQPPLGGQPNNASTAGMGMGVQGGTEVPGLTSVDKSEWQMVARYAQEQKKAGTQVINVEQASKDLGMDPQKLTAILLSMFPKGRKPGQPAQAQTPTRPQGAPGTPTQPAKPPPAEGRKAFTSIPSPDSGETYIPGSEAGKPRTAEEIGFGDASKRKGITNIPAPDNGEVYIPGSGPAADQPQTAETGSRSVPKRTNIPAPDSNETYIPHTEE